MSGPLIEIRGLRVFAHHGVFEHERRDGQEFVIDVTLRATSGAAGDTDDLADAVDYGAVCERVGRACARRPLQPDREAGRCGCHRRCSPNFPVDEVTVRVAKPDAPIPHAFDHVAVTVTRRA